MIFLGIDPGAHGGIAVLDGRDGTLVVHNTPETRQGLWAVLREYGKCDVGPLNGHTPVYAVIEKVGGYVGNPGGSPGSSMFKFGRSYGLLEMALTAAGISFKEVTPQVWQKGLGITPKKRTESPSEWKNRLKAKAQQLFPKIKMTLATCDAALLAEFCRRINSRKGVLK